MPDASVDRPRVSVVVPFFGGPAEARTTLTALAGLETRDGDEVLAVDNSLDDALLERAGEAGSDVRVIASPVKRSAYAARNVGAEAAGNEWLLFLDADCRPAPALLDAYFREPIGERTGALGGEIVGNEGQSGLAARYARARGLLAIDWNRAHPHMPIAVTANMLVRRKAWEALGGFAEGMRAAAGDVDFAWRIQEAGWEFGYRRAAVVAHDHRETVGALLRQTARNAAGAAWLNRRRPGAVPRTRLGGAIARAVGGAVGFSLTGRLERARFKAIDGLFVLTDNLGRLADNAVTPADVRPEVVAIVEAFPGRGGGRLQGLIDLAGSVGLHVEATARSGNPDWRRGRGLSAWFREDEGPLRRGRDFGWLVCRHPFRVLRETIGHHADATPLIRLAPTARRIARFQPRSVLAWEHERFGFADARRLSRLLRIELTGSITDGV